MKRSQTRRKEPTTLKTLPWMKLLDEGFQGIKKKIEKAHKIPLKKWLESKSGGIHGLYLLYGGPKWEKPNRLLYVGKSKQVHTRILQHLDPKTKGLAWHISQDRGWVGIRPGYGHECVCGEIIQCLQGEIQLMLDPKAWELDNEIREKCLVLVIEMTKDDFSTHEREFEAWLHKALHPLYGYGKHTGSSHRIPKQHRR